MSRLSLTGTRLSHDGLHSRECQAKNAGFIFVRKRTVHLSHEVLTESVVDADGPGHSLLTLDGGEYLSRVLESNGSFAQGVADGKEVDKSGKAN